MVYYEGWESPFQVKNTSLPLKPLPFLHLCELRVHVHLREPSRNLDQHRHKHFRSSTMKRDLDRHGRKRRRQNAKLLRRLQYVNLRRLDLAVRAIDRLEQPDRKLRSESQLYTTSTRLLTAMHSVRNPPHQYEDGLASQTNRTRRMVLTWTWTIAFCDKSTLQLRQLCLRHLWVIIHPNTQQCIKTNTK